MDIWIWATSTYFLLCSIHVHLLVVAPGQSRWNQKATNSPISNSLKFLWYGWWYFYSLSGFTSRESLLLIADHTDSLQDGWWAECEKRMESEESPIDDPLGGTGLPRLLLLFLLIRFDVDGTTRSLRTEPPTPTIPALWWNEKSGRIWTVHFLTFAKADKSQNNYCHSLQRYKQFST